LFLNVIRKRYNTSSIRESERVRVILILYRTIYILSAPSRATAITLSGGRRINKIGLSLALVFVVRSTTEEANVYDSLLGGINEGTSSIRYFKRVVEREREKATERE